MSSPEKLLQTNVKKKVFRISHTSDGNQVVAIVPGQNPDGGRNMPQGGSGGLSGTEGQIPISKILSPEVVVDANVIHVSGALEEPPRQLKRLSPQEAIADLKNDITQATSFVELMSLFFDNTPYVTVYGGDDEHWLGSGIKKIIEEAKNNGTAEKIPEYFPELKQKVQQLLDRSGETEIKVESEAVGEGTGKNVSAEDVFADEDDIPIPVTEAISDTFDRISAAYTKQIGGELVDTLQKREMANKLADTGSSDAEILSALLTQDEAVVSMDDPLIPSPDSSNEAIVESTEDWNTFKNAFSEKIKNAETAEALYALIYRVEGGFTDPDTGNFALSADELNNLIYGYFKGDSEIKLADIPYMFREAVQRIAEINGYAPARRMQLESESVEDASLSESVDEEESEAVDGVLLPEVSSLVTENLQEQLEKAKQRMLSARGAYHDAILAHRRLRKLRKGNNDPESAAQEAEKKEAYLAALATYTKLLTEAEIAAYRAEHLGQVRWKSLTQDQLDRFSMRLSADVIPRNEDGSIRDEIIDEQTYIGILTDAEIAALKAQKEFPDAEQAIKARLFTQQFCEDYDRKVDLHIEDGTRNKYEKFIQWWGTLSKGEKVMYGSIAFLSTTALSLFSAKVLAIGGLGVLGKTVFGGVVGAVKGGVFGSMRGARKAYDADQKKQQQTRETITRYLYQWNQAPTHPEGYQKIMAALSDSDARRVNSQISVLESTIAKGIATGAVLGGSAAAILAWFTAEIPSIETPSTSGTTSSFVPSGTTTSALPGAPVVPESVIPSESVSSVSEAATPVSEVIEAFRLRAPDAGMLDIFREMHDTSYDSSSALDRFKMGIIQMLSDKGLMGVSDGLRVPSPALDSFFEQVAGGKNDVEGWRNVANTLRDNYSQLNQGPQFIRNLFTR